MPLTALTLVAGASLGGGVAAQLTVLIVTATVALVLIAGFNGLRMLSRIIDAPQR